MKYAAWIGSLTLLAILPLNGCGETVRKSDGTSCFLTDNEDGTKLLTCGEGSSVIIGEDGIGTTCTAAQQADGSYALECADGSWLPLDQNEDLDGDGYSLATGDCDDVRDDIHPGQPEICDDIDNDCDDLVDADDPGLDWSTALEAYPDEDLDGFGQIAPPTLTCFWGPGLALETGDCDDTNPTIRPDAIEICNGLDDDCDGLTDLEDDSVDQSQLPTYYPDSDSDGFGVTDQGVTTCEKPPSHAAAGGDCDDADPDIHPEQPEICNSVDDDCDGYTDADDDNVEAVYWPDMDIDGYGDENATPSCTEEEVVQPVTQGGDCDDGDPDVNPGEKELRGDGIDQDCDGEDVGWVDVVLGDDDHSNICACARDELGYIACWGGYCPDVPTQTAYSDMALFSSSKTHICAIRTSDGQVECWGDDEYNQSYPPNGSFSRVAVGYGWGCAIETSGGIKCWGTYNDEVTANMPTEGSFEAIEGGDNSVCARYSSGLLKCWGASGNEAVYSPPTEQVTDFAVDDSVGCAVTLAGEIRCWGSDAGGVVADAPSADYGPFHHVAVAYESSSKAVACALDKDGDIRCWGTAWSNNQSVGAPASAGEVFAMSRRETEYSDKCVITAEKLLDCYGTTPP